MVTLLSRSVLFSGSVACFRTCVYRPEKRLVHVKVRTRDFQLSYNVVDQERTVFDSNVCSFWFLCDCLCVYLRELLSQPSQVRHWVSA